MNNKIKVSIDGDGIDVINIEEFKPVHKEGMEFWYIDCPLCHQYEVFSDEDGMVDVFDTYEAMIAAYPEL